MDSLMGRILGVSLLISAFGAAAKAFVRIGEDGRRRLAAQSTRSHRGRADRRGRRLPRGLTSVRTGVFFGLTLLNLFPLRARNVVGHRPFHAAALLYVAAAGHWLVGNVDLHALA
jgi:hypothetical protein